MRLFKDLGHKQLSRLFLVADTELTQEGWEFPGQTYIEDHIGQVPGINPLLLGPSSVRVP